MQSGYFFLVWACAGFCVYSKGKLIFLFKKKKRPSPISDGFFGRDLSGTVSDGKRKPENEVLEWQVAGFGSLIRLTGIYWTSEYKIEWHFYRHMHQKWAWPWLFLHKTINQLTHILWIMQINDRQHNLKGFT